MKNLTEIVSILDCSGSMSGPEDDTFSSFNAVIYEAVGEAVCNVQGRRTLYHIRQVPIFDLDELD